MTPRLNPETAKVDPRTTTLISLANGANLLRFPFDKKELKKRRQRIEQLANGELIGKATKQAIEAAQTAVMVACIMPAVFCGDNSLLNAPQFTLIGVSYT